MYFSPLHIYLQSSFLPFSPPFPFSECRQLWGPSPQTAVSGSRQTIEFWMWHGTRQREQGGGFLPCLPPLSGLLGRTAHSFITALAETTQQSSGKSTPPCFLISHVFFLTSTFVSVTHMNMEDEYGPTSEVLPNSTRGWLVNHEIVFTERTDKFGLVGGTFIPGKFPDLYFMF